MRGKRFQGSVLACLLLGGCAQPVLTGLSGASRVAGGAAQEVAPQKAGDAAGAGLISNNGGRGRTGSSGTSGGAEAAKMSSSGGALVSADAAAMAPAAMPRDAVTADMGPPASEAMLANQVQAGALKAGAVDDNADFGGYLKYRDDFAKRGVSSWGQKPREADVAGRRVIRVVGADGKAIANAQLSIKPSSSIVQSRVLLTSPALPTLLRTYADGRALYHTDSLAKEARYEVSVLLDKTPVRKEFSGGDAEWVIVLQEAPPKVDSLALDLAIVLDTTGSMGGEISKFQATMGAIATRIQGLSQKPSVRYGLVAYRDRDDDYLTRHTDFTSDLNAFSQDLNQLKAGGGGDKPEDLEAGLSVMLDKLQWTEDRNAVRIAVIVADAVPHTNYPQSSSYTLSMRNAAEKGVKLFPIGASGLEAEGEYVMRQLAQWTMGQYMFITRGGDSASGGGSVSAAVDQYSEGRLDDIVVNLVQKELNKFGQ